MMQIALFGTSADPPTSGHQAILRWLSQKFDRVIVWASDNPFKSHQTDLQHRTEMLRVLIEEIQIPNDNLNSHVNGNLNSNLNGNLNGNLNLNSNYNLSPNISLHPELGHRYTIETVRRARNYWPDAEFTFVIGSDLIRQITQWYKIEELLRDVNLLIVPRPNYEVNLEDLSQLQELGGGVAIASMMGLPVSSTDYRKAGKVDALTAPVQAYIWREGLYKSTVKE
ncbi:MAG: nicotinate-nucleotide adenylyltransferase [Microcoleaceae cyanobacterium]